MDDLLTILLVVGWIILGIYQNSRKQKKLNEAKRQATTRKKASSTVERDVATGSQGSKRTLPPPPVPEMKETPIEEPELDDVLGELLGIPTQPKPKPQSQPAAGTPTSQPASPVKAEPYSPLAYTPLIEQINKPQYESIEFREEHLTPGYHIDNQDTEHWSHPMLHDFDLRQAIIYSAILHRPYR